MEITETANQYLTFTLDKEQYAVDVAKVREVLEVPDLTKIPRMPDYMIGVINIRGHVVPVIDLRTKFGMERIEHTVRTSIVVTEIASQGDLITIGCLADSVQEVVDITSDQIEDPPKIGTTVDTDFIAGVGKKDDRFIIILDVDRVFRDAELSAVAGSVQKKAGTEQPAGV
ncbi:MAG: purine-binding chemotaxis protein CheW [Spirochaetaceae bacterium]|nr:MAG: purine-binding chemotaxis protein CheW [Spirochaetaceae bacterium]